MNGMICIVGLNHESAPVEVREQLAFDTAASAQLLRDLVALPSVEEGVIVGTCNRVEVVAVVRNESRGFEEIHEFLRARQIAPKQRLDLEHFYFHAGDSAVRHLFRVAASLDSMVVGEPQILGQLKAYYTMAQDAGTVGTILHRLFHRSFSVGKKVRQETEIGSRPVSVSSVAVDLARRIFDRIEEKTVMVIGAGRMGELLVRHLIQNGVKRLMITNRTFERAVILAEKFHASPIRFEDYVRYLKLADMVVGSVESKELLIERETVAEVLRERKQEAMFFIDLGVPRNFDPRINEMDNVYLYHMDDLQEVSRENLKGREDEADKAERFVDLEVQTFQRWIESLSQVPTIVALKRRFEAIRQGEIHKSLETHLKNLSPREKQAVDDLTAAMINKILHTPLTRLKSQSEEDRLYLDALRDLFDLDKG